MHNSMVLGTIVVLDKGRIRIRSKDQPLIPIMMAPPGMKQATCLSALTKMTMSLYKNEIEVTKHGKDATKFMAVEMLMKTTDNCLCPQTQAGAGPWP